MKRYANTGFRTWVLMSARTEEEQLLMDHGWTMLRHEHKDGEMLWLTWQLDYDPLPVVEKQSVALAIVRERIALSPPPHLNKEETQSPTNDASGGGGEQK